MSTRAAAVVKVARAFQTATTTASGGGAVNPTDTNANPNLFGNSGPTPVIPAFVLSGVLLVVLVTICTWRRMLAMRRAGADEARVVARYGPFGITFVTVVNGVNAGGVGRRRREEEKVLGPKPELWDAYTRREGWGEENGEKEGAKCTWKGMKPLSLSLVPPPTSASDRTSENDDSESPTATASSESTRQPYLTRKVLRLKTKAKNSRSERKTDAAATTSASENTNHEVEVSVLIRMPSPTRPRPRRFSSDATSIEKEKGRADFYDDTNDGDDFNYSLGVATVPLVLEEHSDPRS